MPESDKGVKELRLIQFTKFIGRCVSILLFGVALFFIGKTIVQNWAMVSEGPEYFRADYFFVGVLLFQFYFFYQILLWRWIMSGFGTRLNYLTVSQMYFTSNLLAYIPGKVANVVGMADLARRKRVSVTHTVTTLLLIQLYLLITGTLLIAIMSLFIPSTFDKVLILDHVWLIVLASMAGLVLISPKYLRLTFAFVRRLSGRDIAFIELPFHIAAGHMFALILGWILAGLALCCILSSFSPVELPLTSVIAVLIGSYLIGFLAFFVPAGLGITEASMIYGLGDLIGSGNVLFGAVSYRLVTISITLVSWLAITLFLHNVKVSQHDAQKSEDKYT